MLKENMIIASVRGNDAFREALMSDAELIFDLHPDINTLKTKVKYAHEKGKRIFIHLDLADGIGKDKSGIAYARKAGIDGIISTRANLIKSAREAGLCTVQRFFALDSQSVDNITETLKSSGADMIEIMPGVVAKVIAGLSAKVDVPVIAGGLIDSLTEINCAFRSGASAVSVSRKELWKNG